MYVLKKYSTILDCRVTSYIVKYWRFSWCPTRAAGSVSNSRLEDETKQLIIFVYFVALTSLLFILKKKQKISLDMYINIYRKACGTF